MTKNELITKLKKYKTRIAAGTLSLAIAAGIISCETQNHSDDNSKNNDRLPNSSDFASVTPNPDLEGGGVTNTNPDDPNNNFDDELDNDKTPDSNNNAEDNHENLEENNHENNDDLNNNDSNSKDLDPENKDESNTHHTHNYTAWISLDDDGEVRTCSCGKKEIRSHTYEEKIAIVPNNDGTYNEITTYTCSNCNHIKSTVITKPCKFGPWHFNPETNEEERECSISRYIETRKHDHQYQLIAFNNTYEYYECTCKSTKREEHNLVKETNPDGSITYKCSTCDYSYTLDKEEETEDQHHHDFILKDYDDDMEYYECSCGETKSVPHVLEMMTNPDGSLTTFCKNCSYIKTTAPTHEHNFAKLRKYDASYEYWLCECGEEVRKPHNMTIEKNPDGSITHSCTTCDYHYVEQPSHTHSWSNWHSLNDSEEIRDCPTCGASEKRGHTLKTSEKDGIITTTCDTCDYKKQEKHKDHSFTLSSWDNNGETWSCICGEQEYHNHNVDKTHGTQNLDFSMDYSCSNPGCGYTEHVDHTHSYTEFKRSDDSNGEIWGCECGRSEILKDHNISNGKCTTPGCGYEESKECKHKNTKDEYKEFTNDADSYCCYQVTTCTDCNQEVIRVQQAHNWQIELELPDIGKIERCALCNQTRQIFYSKTNNVNNPYILERKKRLYNEKR